MTDDQNSQKMLVDCIHIVDIEFSIDPGRIYSTVDVFIVICMQNITQSYELPISFRMAHKQRMKLNRLGSYRAKAKKYFDSWKCAEPCAPPFKSVICLVMLLVNSLNYTEF